MSGEPIVLAGDVNGTAARLVETIARLAELNLGPYALVGGLAVMCRLAAVHRATQDIDTVTEATVAMFGANAAADFSRDATRPETTGDVVAWLVTQPEAKALAGTLISSPGFFKARGISFP